MLVPRKIARARFPCAGSSTPARHEVKRQKGVEAVENDRAADGRTREDSKAPPVVVTREARTTRRRVG